MKRRVLAAEGPGAAFTIAGLGDLGTLGSQLSSGLPCPCKVLVTIMVTLCSSNTHTRKLNPHSTPMNQSYGAGQRHDRPSFVQRDFEISPHVGTWHSLV